MSQDVTYVCFYHLLAVSKTKQKPFLQHVSFEQTCS